MSSLSKQSVCHTISPRVGVESLILSLELERRLF